jgi:hypothetical protein
VSFLFLVTVSRREGILQLNSSPLTPFLKYVFINFFIAIFLVLIQLGFVYTSDLFTVAITGLIIFFIPVRYFLVSKFINMSGDSIYFSAGYQIIGVNDVIGVNRVLFGMLYRLKYKQGETTKNVLFFPENYPFFFLEPDGVKYIRGYIHKKIDCYVW